MRKKNCSHCGRNFGLNELVSVFDKVLCRDCTETHLKTVSQKEITPQTVYALCDSSICARCGMDNGLDQYELFLDAPFCPTCHKMMKRYPFPPWIKAACIIIVLMVGFTVYINLRFFNARILLAQSTRLAFEEGQWEQASRRMETASTLVPESPELNTLWHYMAGVHELDIENFENAIDHLERCSELPKGYEVEVMLLSAKSGKAFDNKDYAEFLRVSEQKQQLYPNEPMVLAQVSSAHACIYALEGREEDKQKSLESLQQAEKLSGQQISEPFAKYRDRILHRLETREILSREDYELKEAKQEK